MNNWKDVNIKFDRERGNAVVEMRPFSIQPSIREDLALSAFMMGRIAYAQENGEELMDIEKVNENREKAMYNGLDTELYGSSGELADATDVLENELDYAREGLDSLGVDYENFIEEEEDIFDVTFGKRLKYGKTPGDRSAEAYSQKRREMADREALSEVMKDYRVRGETN